MLLRQLFATRAKKFKRLVVRNLRYIDGKSVAENIFNVSGTYNTYVYTIFIF